MTVGDKAPSWEQVLEMARKLVASGSVAPDEGLLLAQMVVDFERSIHPRTSRPPPHRMAD